MLGGNPAGTVSTISYTSSVNNTTRLHEKELVRKWYISYLVFAAIDLAGLYSNWKALILEGNQEDLKRLRDIILATIDYSLQWHPNIMKIDGVAIRESHYQKIKQNTEKYFKLHDQAKLQRILSKLLKEPAALADLNFQNYIQEKTGNEINIFQDFEIYVDKIIKQNKIRNDKEFHIATSILVKLKQQATDENKINLLNSLCREYSMRRTKNKKVVITDRYRPKKLSDVESPNKKFKIIIWEDERNGEYGTTSVFVSNKNASAGMYDAEGVNLNIKVYWKDDNRIIIESKKEIKVLGKHYQIQFGNDVIEVNLIEL